MSTESFPSSGRVALSELVVAQKYLFAFSRGNPAWDAMWTSPNPPRATLAETDVIDLIGYVRPTIVDFLKIDAAGQIVDPGGAKFSVSATPTRYARIRASLPVGTFAGQTVREIGLFQNPTIKASVPSGQIVISAADVEARGRLFQLHWREPYPIAEGDFFARNFILRL